MKDEPLNAEFYRGALVSYMKHIIACESVSYMASVTDDTLRSRFTDQQSRLLWRIADELDCPQVPDHMKENDNAK